MFHRWPVAIVLVTVPDACSVPPSCQRHEVSVAVTPAGSGTGWYGACAATAVALGVGGVGATTGIDDPPELAARVVAVVFAVAVVVELVAGAVVVLVDEVELDDVRVAAALSSDFPGFGPPFAPAANTSAAPIAIDASAIAQPTISVRRGIRAGGATYVVSGTSSMPGARRLDQYPSSETQPSPPSFACLVGPSWSVIARSCRLGDFEGTSERLGRGQRSAGGQMPRHGLAGIGVVGLELVVELPFILQPMDGDEPDVIGRGGLRDGPGGLELAPVRGVQVQLPGVIVAVMPAGSEGVWYGGSVGSEYARCGSCVPPPDVPPAPPPAGVVVVVARGPDPGPETGALVVVVDEVLDVVLVDEVRSAALARVESPSPEPDVA